MPITDARRKQPPITAMEMASFLDDAADQEREACAALVEKMPMGEILLAAGEMTTGERRTARALQKWFAHKIRTRKQ